MTTDLLWNFYYSCIRSQYLAQTHFKSDNNQINQLRTQVYRDLGNSLRDLLNAAISSRHRSQRSYRLKYVEDTDFAILEACLISVANRIVLDSDKDPTVQDCLPYAQELMDKFTTLQVLISATIHEAEKNAWSQERQPMTSSYVSEYVIDHLSKSAPTMISTLTSTVSQGVNSNTPANCRLALGIMRQNIPPPPPKRRPEGFKGDNSGQDDFLLDHLRISDTLFEQLSIMDESLAQFEWAFVRFISRKVRTRLQAEELQELTVLFSETLIWALAISLIDLNALEDRDPAILLALPRLAILLGCRLMPFCAIGTDRFFSGKRMPYLFHGRLLHDLSMLNRQLATLTPLQWRILVVWLGPQGLPHAFTEWLSSQNDSPGSMNLIEVKRLAPVYNFSGLHLLYKKVSSVADSLAGKHSTEMRFILQKAIEMNDTPFDPDCQSTSSTNQKQPPPQDQEEDELQRFLFGDQGEKSLQLHSKTVQLTPWWECDWATTVSLYHKDSFHSIGSKSDSGASLEQGVDVAALLDQLQHDNEETSEAHHSHHDEDKLRKLLNTLIPDQEEQQQQSMLTTLPTIDDLATGMYFSMRPPNKSAEINKSKLLTKQSSSASLAPWQPDQGGIRLTTTSEQQKLWRKQNELSYSCEDQDDEDEDASEEQQDSYSSASDAVIRWKPQGSGCARCLSGFTVYRRRHHCRRCGHIFCDSCSNQFRSLPGLSDMQRVCLDCNEFLGPPVACNF